MGSAEGIMTLWSLKTRRQKMTWNFESAILAIHPRENGEFIMYEKQKNR